MNHDATTSIYRFNATNGITCILISVDGLISIKYRNKLNEDVEADLYLPDNPVLGGECVESNMEILTLEFKGFKLSMTFKKVSLYACMCMCVLLLVYVCVTRPITMGVICLRCKKILRTYH